MGKHMRRPLASLAASLALAAVAAAAVAIAQDAPNQGIPDQGPPDEGTSDQAAPEAAVGDAILVLDGSGSMWGEVDGRRKILIARDVIGDLLDALPPERRLGLVTYGHRRRGDCTDIETVAEVGTDRQRIRSAVDNLSPLGMTPLSAAVRHAAEELRYSENPATVILVSDGEETCDADPCALGAELEATGVNFTAHVIGFDISSDEERRQLQCLADATGGRFIVAANADELSDALSETVVAAPPPAEVEPAPARLRLQATDLSSGPVIQSGIVWRVAVAGEGGEEIYLSNGLEGMVTLEDLEPRAYDVTVTRPDDGATAEGRIDMREGQTRTLTLALEIHLDATLRTEPDGSAPAGSEILVHWTGPARDGDWIAISDVGSDEGDFVTYKRVDASPITIRMPSEPGEYEARYMLARPYRTLATAPITATEVEASVTPPETAYVGSDIKVAWTGPDYGDDYIYIAEPDMADNQQISYARLDGGSPAAMTAPADPGTYEARYILNGSPDRVLARATFEVMPSEASVTPPESVEAGAPLAVAWTGPDNEGDYIYISDPEMRDNQQVTYTRTDRGNPAELIAPGDPGTYEARYVLGVGSRVIARTTFEVTPASATVTPPETVEAGSELSIAWTGPNNEGDYIYVSEMGSRDNQQVGYTRTDRGNPAVLRAPGEPGEYEARYILNADTRVIARAPFVVSPASATITAPQNVEAGSRFEVAWDGPDNDGDYIYLAEAGMRANEQVTYDRTSRGNPTILDAPGEPGEYEVRYILGAGTRIIASAPVTVTPATASFSDVPESAPADGTVTVTWLGPGNERDFIAIAELGSRDNQFATYQRARDPGPIELPTPSLPGDYEVRYVLGSGNVVIARQPILVISTE